MYSIFFSYDELLKFNKISNLDSVKIQEICESLKIKSLRIHLNDGSYQGVFHLYTHF